MPLNGKVSNGIGRGDVRQSDRRGDLSLSPPVSFLTGDNKLDAAVEGVAVVTMATVPSVAGSLFIISLIIGSSPPPAPVPSLVYSWLEHVVSS